MVLNRANKNFLLQAPFNNRFLTGLVLIRRCATWASVETNENYIMTSQWKNEFSNDSGWIIKWQGLEKPIIYEKKTELCPWCSFTSIILNYVPIWGSFTSIIKYELCPWQAPSLLLIWIMYLIEAPSLPLIWIVPDRGSFSSINLNYVPDWGLFTSINLNYVPNEPSLPLFLICLSPLHFL